MWTMRARFLFAAVALLLASPTYAASPSWSCFGEFASVLKEADFPTAGCKLTLVKIRYAGKIHSGGKMYLIYHYHYEDNPKYLGTRQQHSLNRILIFVNDKKHFLGDYAMADGFETTVVGNHIHVLTDGQGFTQDIWIGPDGPPQKVILGGEESGFGR